MNAYDDLPPLSLVALGSPIRTIYSSRKPMRIQSCWSLCPRRVIFLQKVTRSLHFFFNIDSNSLVHRLIYLVNVPRTIEPRSQRIGCQIIVYPWKWKFFTLPLNLWIPTIHHRREHLQGLVLLGPSHDTSQEESQHTDRVCCIFIASTQHIGIAPNLNRRPGFGTRISRELHFIRHPNSNWSA